MIIYAWLTVALGIYMLLFTLGNILYLLLINREPAAANGPRVSVLIPARNEADRITPAIEGLLKQDYQNFEVIVLDDNSEDDTRGVVEALISPDNRFRVISGCPLPDGWKGKPYAMQQLQSQADGDILIFSDADMKPEPDMVSWTVQNLEHHRVDFLSGYARHTAPEFKEYFLFPVMYLATSFLLPLWLFRHTKTYMFSHAIGQYFCIRSSVLRELGGFEPVKDKINEDIQMARYLKGKGYSQVFLDAKKRISGNMYDSLDHAKMGIMRVVYEYFDNQIYPFIFMGLVMVFLLLLPPLAAVYGILTQAAWTAVIGMGIGLTLLGWLCTMVNRRQPWYLAFFYPAHFFWALCLSVKSIYLSKRGWGYQWKGRTVR